MPPLETKIPKIIHQIWIGDAPRPAKLMETWQIKNPDYEYILWNEAEIAARGMQFACQQQIDNISAIEGKADIMRLEILNKYGGIYVDADSVCLEPLDQEVFLTHTGFAAFENENARGHLIATVVLGFVPSHPLLVDMINYIHDDPEAQALMSQYKAWYALGPGLITRFLDKGHYTDNMTIFPSHFFLPYHFTGHVYDGHKKVYAHQFWGNTRGIYDTIDTIPIPSDLLTPTIWVSLLVVNDGNAPIRQCLDSIREQYGRQIGIQLVWVDNGDDIETPKKELRRFLKLSRFCQLDVYKMQTHVDMEELLQKGADWCSHDIKLQISVKDKILPQFLLENLKRVMH
jgi:Glycosyltransferase sugar-binding region containing DXD motif